MVGEPSALQRAALGIGLAVLAIVLASTLPGCSAIITAGHAAWALGDVVATVIGLVVGVYFGGLFVVGLVLDWRERARKRGGW